MLIECQEFLADGLLFFERFDKQGDESGIIQRYSVPAIGFKLDQIREDLANLFGDKT